MRAITYRRHGAAREVLTLGTHPIAAPGPNEFTVALAFSGVNPTDVKRRALARAVITKAAGADAAVPSAAVQGRDHRIRADLHPARGAAIDFLHRALSAGALHCPVDRIYPLSRTAEAHESVEQGGRAGATLIDVTS